MAAVPDLNPLAVFGEQYADVLRAVGWLGRDQPFNTGPTPSTVFERLRSLLNAPFQPVAFAGSHRCDLCQFEGEASSCANLFVPGDGKLLVCPALILHYINAHRYQPPSVFCDAVLACPDTHSPEYKRRFLANGGRELVRRAV